MRIATLDRGWSASRHGAAVALYALALAVVGAFLTRVGAAADPAPSPGSGLQAPKVAVLPIRAPAEVSVDASLGYKLKSGLFRDPDAMDFDDLGGALRAALVKSLREKLGDGAVEVPKAGAFGVAADDSAGGSGAEKSAPYLVKTLIHKIRFEGNDFIPNYYEMTVSAEVASRETGDVVWKSGHHTIVKMLKTEKKVEPDDLFIQRVVPEAASYLADRIVKAMAS